MRVCSLDASPETRYGRESVHDLRSHPAYYHRLPAGQTNILIYWVQVSVILGLEAKIIRLFRRPSSGGRSWPISESEMPTFSQAPFSPRESVTTRRSFLAFLLISYRVSESCPYIFSSSDGLAEHRSDRMCLNQLSFHDIRRVPVLQTVGVMFTCNTKSDH